MSYDLNFLEACKALDEKKCTKIENELGAQYTVNRVGILSSVSDPQNGIERAPGGFLVKWKLVDKVPVMHEQVIENVLWYENATGVVSPHCLNDFFPWADLLSKPKMQMILRWRE